MKDWEIVAGIGVVGAAAYFLTRPQQLEQAYVAEAIGRNGLSGFPSSTYNVQRVIDQLKAQGSILYRMSFTPQWEGGSFHPDYVQYFLNNAPSNYMVIVDRNHLYPNTEAQASRFRANLSTARSNIMDICSRWPNNQRVIAELVNEYVSPDIKTQMQSLINSVRNAGYTNPLLVNKMAQNWSSVKFTDPKSNVYTGFHPYFNTWSPSSAESQMNTAIAAGLKLINTEIGADYREYSYYTSSTVTEVNQFLQWCTDRGIGNCVWMNSNLDNLLRYQQLGLKVPVSYSSQQSYTLGVQASIPVQFNITNIGSYTTPKYLSLPVGTYQINMPASVYYGGRTQYFRYWGSGQTSPIRTIALSDNIYPYATYS